MGDELRVVTRVRWIVLQVGEYSTQEVGSPYETEASAWEGAEWRASEDFERYTVVRVVCRVTVGPDDDAPSEFPRVGLCYLVDGKVRWYGNGTTWERR